MDTTKILIVLVVLAGLVFWFGLIPGTPKLGIAGQPITANVIGTSLSTTTVANTAQLLFATNSGAQRRCISNQGTTTVTLGFGTTTGLTATSGFAIFPSSTAIFSGDSLYTGNTYLFSPSNGTIISGCQL